MALAAAIITALGAIGSATIGANAGTKTKTSSPVAAAGGTSGPAQNVFAQGVPQKPVTQPSSVSGSAPQVDIGSILAAATQGGQAGAVGGAVPNPGGGAATQPSKGQEVLKSLPGALADIAPLLALFQPAQTHYGIIGGQGGPQGQLVQGFNLPREPGRPSIGELLQSLPRARYAG